MQGCHDVLLTLVEHLNELAELPAPPLGGLGLPLGERAVGGRDDRGDRRREVLPCHLHLSTKLQNANDTRTCWKSVLLLFLSCKRFMCFMGSDLPECISTLALSFYSFLCFYLCLDLYEEYATDPFSNPDYGQTLCVDD